MKFLNKLFCICVIASFISLPLLSTGCKKERKTMKTPDKESIQKTAPAKTKAPAKKTDKDGLPSTLTSLENPAKIIE